jgi:transposase
MSDRPAELDSIPDGVTVAAIAARLDVPIRTVRGWLGESDEPVQTDETGPAGVRRSADRAELARLYLEERLPVPVIAEQMGVSHQRVYQLLGDIGLTGRPRVNRARWDPASLAEQATAAASVSELARTLGVHRNVARKALLRYNIPIPHRANDVDAEELRRLHAGGETIAGLARHFEITRDRVRRLLG